MNEFTKDENAIFQRDICGEYFGESAREWKQK